MKTGRSKSVAWKSGSFNRLPVVPGKLSYKDANDRNKFHEGNISIFSDIIPKAIRWKEFNSYVNFVKVRLETRGKLETVLKLYWNSSSDAVIER